MFNKYEVHIILCKLEYNKENVIHSIIRAFCCVHLINMKAYFGQVYLWVDNYIFV